MEAMEAPQLLGGLADRHSMHTFTTLVASARTRSVMNNQQREWRRYSHPCTASTHTLGCTARRELVQNVALHSLLALGELDCHLLQHRFAVADGLGAKAGEQLGLGLSSSCRVAHITIGVVVTCSLQDVARALDVAAWQQRHTSPQHTRTTHRRTYSFTSFTNGLPCHSATHLSSMAVALLWRLSQAHVFDAVVRHVSNCW